MCMFHVYTYVFYAGLAIAQIMAVVMVHQTGVTVAVLLLVVVGGVGAGMCGM